MEKLLKLCRKTLPIIFGSIFLGMLIITIMVGGLSHGKTYRGSRTIDGVNTQFEITFKKSTCDIYEGEATSARVFNYSIRNKELYLGTTDIAGGTIYKVGNISSTKINTSVEVIGDPTLQNLATVTNITLTCNGTSTIKALAVTFMVLSGLLAVACVVVTFLQSKGTLKLNFAKKGKTAAPKAKAEPTAEDTVTPAAQPTPVAEPTPAPQPAQTNETYDWSAPQQQPVAQPAPTAAPTPATQPTASTTLEGDDLNW